MGKAGRPKGSIHPLRKQLKQIAKELAVDHFAEVIRRGMSDKDVKNALTALRLCLEYGYGRPHQTMDVGFSGVSLLDDVALHGDCGGDADGDPPA